MKKRTVEIIAIISVVLLVIIGTINHFKVITLEELLIAKTDSISVFQDDSIVEDRIIDCGKYWKFGGEGYKDFLKLERYECLHKADNRYSGLIALVYIDSLYDRIKKLEEEKNE